MSSVIKAEEAFDRKRDAAAVREARRKVLAKGRGIGRATQRGVANNDEPGAAP